MKDTISVILSRVALGFTNFIAIVISVNKAECTYLHRFTT